jgi:hypothetical protein
MPSRPKALANRRNAQRSTGPKTDEGKLASSQNARKHGLSVEVDFESSDAYQALKFLLIETGYSPFVAADIATGLLHYRRVMDAYYETYRTPKPVDVSLWERSMKKAYKALNDMAEGTSVTSDDNRKMVRVLARMQRTERRQGGPLFRRTADCHKLIRYQQNAISRLAKAIRSA